MAQGLRLALGDLLPRLVIARGQAGEMLDFLREKSLLLVLDNCEHLLEAAPLTQDILRAAPQVKILVTSRLPLDVRGEHRHHLGGLDFPSWETPQGAPDYGAVKLFVQDARSERRAGRSWLEPQRCEPAGLTSAP